MLKSYLRHLRLRAIFVFFSTLNCSGISDLSFFSTLVYNTDISSVTHIIPCFS
jgi:hypothetical protein